MREVKAPARPGLELRVFLAGSIDMRQAERWQDRVADALAADAADVVILNPRRDAWDDSWVQEADDPQFAKQVPTSGHIAA